MRMLDNVIDINYYAVKKARDSNMRHRPVGLGIMAFQDCLYDAAEFLTAQREAVEFADRSMEAVCYYAYRGIYRFGQRARQVLQATRALCGTGASCPSTRIDLLAQAAWWLR
jgi:ribonucleoside-diphosphate reductase alpha chain